MELFAQKTEMNIRNSQQSNFHCEMILFKWANPGLFLFIFAIFQCKFYSRKNVCFSKIRTWIVGIEGQHADHLTTTTAQCEMLPCRWCIKIFGTLLTHQLTTWADAHSCCSSPSTVVEKSPNKRKRGRERPFYKTTTKDNFLFWIILPSSDLIIFDNYYFTLSRFN